MATVLYITAHPHDHQTSFSLAVGKEFIDAYREANPSDEVISCGSIQTRYSSN